MHFATRNGAVYSKLSPHFILHRAVTTFYLLRGRRPKSKGYISYRQEYIYRTLNNPQLMDLFRTNKPLPCNYGRGLDERVVEYPWILARINPGMGTILDAGSTLNYQFICQHPSLAQKNIIIYTLSPYGENHISTPRISYIYGDLRDTILRDNIVDNVISISTIEHIGMNNDMYTKDTKFFEKQDGSFILAIQELYRSLKPGGRLLLTVPYGLPQDLDWLFQFDEDRLKTLIDSFKGKTLEKVYYRRDFSGWQIATMDECKDCEFNYGASAVACVNLMKC